MEKKLQIEGYIGIVYANANENNICKTGEVNV